MQWLAINLNGNHLVKKKSWHKEFIYTQTNLCDVVKGYGKVSLFITCELTLVEFCPVQFEWQNYH